MRGKLYKFTEQIFFDFVRPPTDSCFAIREAAFEAGGGFRQEFVDKEKKLEVYGEGWRLLFKLEMQGAEVLYVNHPFYNASPRRLLQEPEKFLGFRSYKPGSMSDQRKEGESAYKHLNKLAKTIDLTPVKRYIIEYYIILKCITRPYLVYKNSQYFGSFKKQLYNDILNWRKNNPNPSGKDIFDFARDLNHKYFKRILAAMPMGLVR
jgi:hypothetical protein